MKNLLLELLGNERDYLDYFFQHLDVDKLAAILDLFYHCKGIIFFTGVGKSGFIAKKIAMTITSTGSKALFVSPTDALHGDIGIVSSNDLFVILSKSGESDELITLLPSVRQKGAKLIAFVSDTKSRLAQGSDSIFHIPLSKELCPFDMAPTTSTVSQMIVGDLLAIGLMRLRNFSLDAFAQNHPAGRLGKRITMKVQDLMLKETAIPICKPNDRIIDILVELSSKRCGCVLVVDPGHKLQGIFTDGDLRRSMQKGGQVVLDSPVKEFMTTTPKITHSHKLAWDAMKIMEGDPNQLITVLPVVDDSRKVVGLLKLHDIIRTGL